MSEIRGVLARYQGSIEHGYQDICGESSSGVGPADTYDAFSTWAKGTGLWEGIVRGTTTEYAVGNMYRRFLNRGANCPEDTTGRMRWEGIRNQHPLPARGLFRPREVTLGDGSSVWQLAASEVFRGDEADVLLAMGRSALQSLGLYSSNLTLDAPPPHFYGIVGVGLPEIGTDDLISGPIRMEPLHAAELGIEPGYHLITLIENPDGYSVSVLINGKYSGTVSMLDEYARLIAQIEDPHQLLAAWEEYVAAIIDHASELRPTMEGFARLQEAGHHPSVEDVEALIAPITSLFGVLNSAFGPPLQRAIDAVAERDDRTTVDGEIERPLSAASLPWEHQIIRAQRDRLSNFLTILVKFAELLAPETREGDEVQIMAQALREVGDPFIHLLRSFVSYPHTQERVRIEFPDELPDIDPRAPSVLLRAINAIVYTAGRGERAPGAPAPTLRVEWDEAARRLSFSSADALGDYGNVTLTPPIFLLGDLVARMGEGSGVNVTADAVGTRIDITVPLRDSPQGPGNGAGGSDTGFSGARRASGPAKAGEAPALLLGDASGTPADMAVAAFGAFSGQTTGATPFTTAALPFPAMAPH